MTAQDDSQQEMLDPDWTPEKGYAHALELLALAEQAEARMREEEK